MPRITMQRANIRQHENLYVEAIERHGQYVRWYSRVPCFCMDDNGRASPTCKICNGRGNRFYPQLTVRRVDGGLGNGSIKIEVRRSIKSINRIMTSANTDVQYSSFSGQEITLNNSYKEGKYYYVDYEENLEHNYVGKANYKGNGIIEIPIVGKSTIYGDFVGELVTVSSVINNTKSSNMSILSIWENMLLTDGYADEGDDIDVVCKYVKPLKFLIADVKSKTRYEMARIGITIDMQASFPGYYTVGAGDLITLLKAEQKGSIIGIGDGSFHRLPFFHVTRLVRIEDKNGAIEDASIVRNNEIKWGSRLPEGKFSVSLMFHPSFIVLEDLPSLRYAEDKVFPKRVYLRKWDLDSRGSRRPRIPMESGLEGMI